MECPVVGAGGLIEAVKRYLYDLSDNPAVHRAAADPTSQLIDKRVSQSASVI